MASQYPSIVTSLTYPNANNRLNAPSHSSIHGVVNDEIHQIETFVGTLSSTVGTLVYDIRSASSSGGGHVQAANFGGTGQTSYTKGDVLVATSSSVLTKLSVGVDGTVLTANSSVTAGVDWEGRTLPTGAMIDFAGSSAPSGFLLCDGSPVSRFTYGTLFGIISTTWGAGDGSTTFNVPDSRNRVSVGKGTGTKVATFASRSSNVITVTGLTNALNNEFQTGDVVQYSTTSSVITGLTNSTNYYVVRTGNLAFSLASSLANAQNGTAIALSSDGSGIQTFTLTFTTRTLGDTGGEENHAQNISELLSHSHVVNSSGSGTLGINGSSGNSFSSNLTNTTGGNSAMNIMSPFYVVTKIIKT